MGRLQSQEELSKSDLKRGPDYAVDSSTPLQTTSEEVQEERKEKLPKPKEM